MILSKQEAAEYGRRPTPRRTRESMYYIDGEYISKKQIAERLGISDRKLQKVWRKAVDSDGPITMDKLRGISNGDDG